MKSKDQNFAAELEAILATPIPDSSPESADLVAARNQREAARRALKAHTAAHGSTAERRSLETRLEAADAEIAKLEPEQDAARDGAKKAASQERHRRASILSTANVENVRSIVPHVRAIIDGLERGRTIWLAGERDFSRGQGIVRDPYLRELVDFATLWLERVAAPIVDPPKNGHPAAQLLRIIQHPTPASWNKRRRAEFAELPVSRMWTYVLGDLASFDRKTSEFLVAVGCAELFAPDAPVPDRDLDGLDALLDWNRRNLITAREWRIARGLEKE